jgi:peptide deformylase
LDHLVGKLYVDRMKDIKTLMFEEEMVFDEIKEEVLD